MDTFNKTIIHGPRRIGISIMLLHHALRECDRNPGSVGVYSAPTGAMLKLNMEMAHSIMFSHRQSSNVSFFDRSFGLSHGNQQYSLKFNNGSELIFSFNPLETIYKLEWADILVVDNGDNYDDLNEISKCDANKISIGHTGSAFCNGNFHSVYLDSMKGKNDYYYYRLDWRVSDKLNEVKDRMIEAHGEEFWNIDAEYLLKPDT